MRVLLANLLVVLLVGMLLVVVLICMVIVSGILVRVVLVRVFMFSVVLLVTVLLRELEVSGVAAQSHNLVDMVALLSHGIIRQLTDFILDEVDLRPFQSNGVVFGLQHKFQD
jgi:hypothetical protein